MAAMAGIDSKSLVSQADIVKQIWKELPKHMDTPVAPLDEEMLVDLAKEPAVIEGARKADGMVGIFGSKPCYILVFLLRSWFLTRMTWTCLGCFSPWFSCVHTVRAVY
jgi:hypothetical protein